MMRYVALLRGINVGGNHRVSKDEFRQVLESLGYRDVVIYINSGNAVFTSDSEVRAVEVQTALEKYFGFAIPTLVLSSEKIRAIADAIPVDWTNDPPKPDKSGQKSDVLYLFDEINTPDILEKLGEEEAQRLYEDIADRIMNDPELLEEAVKTAHKSNPFS